VGGKAIQEYDRYVEKIRNEHYKEESKLIVEKASIQSEKDIKHVEAQEDFVRWI
jgi:hypothetical protein